MSSDQLLEIFQKFCAFGSHSNLVSADRLTNQKFAKLCKDCRVVGNGPNAEILSSDIDIMFNKVKSKSERTIDFIQMTEALKLIAIKKFGKGENNSFERLCEEMFEQGGPRLATGTTVPDSDEALNRLTDHSQYTGTHKNRFDDAGKGLGREGRVDNTGIIQFSQITNRKEADKRGVQSVSQTGL